MICKNCGSEIDDNAWECPHCLIDITPEMREEAKRQANGEGPAQVQYAPPPAQTQYAPPPAQQQYAPPPAQQQYGPAPQQPRAQYAPPQQPRAQYAPPPVMQQNALPRDISAGRQEVQHTFDRPSFYQPPTSFEDKVEVPLVIATLLVPLWGLVMGINNMQKGKKHSGKVYLLLWGLIRMLPIALAVLFYILIIFFAAMFG